MTSRRLLTAVAAAALLLLTPPAASAQVTPHFSVEPTMSRGPATAPVTLYEWSDYQCPYCREAQDVLEQLRSDFVDSVRFVYKDFPLRMHILAMPAASAARCAGAQGRYWSYHDLLFLAQPDFSSEQLVGYAQRLGLDVPAFTECLNSARYQEAIMADVREGLAAGVQATPTFFINGRKIEGALPLDEFREAIRRALREAAGPAR
ncbi:MAG TPA: thioredoxin domain-containing protein [Candidatus Bathyarchaeia archaeon]|nr:thioredoxin domain-containing protein [Candidatus Bathyarchaeia archaeon]